MRISHRRRHRLVGRVFVLGAGVLMAATLAPRSAVAADTQKVLYNFCTHSGCTDGAAPVAGLIKDASGNLYGTTNLGGAANGGTVFELTPNAAKTKWTQTVLYSFCAQTSCTDGEGPRAGLLLDASGRLYGTTERGGAANGGTVFELRLDAAKTAWTQTVLYSFCAQNDCADGQSPYAGLIQDASGNLYGTTDLGGAQDQGTVFELTPNAAKTAWAQTVLYSFCVQNECTDGSGPFNALIQDASGNLYGTTEYGGAHEKGTVFELKRKTAKSAWTETVLYSFCAQSTAQAECADGGVPVAGLLRDASGNLYGTTSGVGTGGAGTAFELTPNAAKTVWALTTLYSFCTQADCADGDEPIAGLIADGSGNLYGATSVGGANDQAGLPGGTVFELTPNAAKTSWTQTVLYSFCAQASCADGEVPLAGLVREASGNLYGTTEVGGAHGEGTVFELKP